MNQFSLPAFKTPLLVFSLTVWLWCAYMWISKFTLHGPLWTSCIYRLKLFITKLFIKFGKLLTLISSNILSDPFTLSFASGTPITYIFLLLMVLHISNFLVIFLHSFFSPVSDWIISVDLSSSLLIFFFCQCKSTLESLLWIFPFRYHNFQLQNNYLVLF